MSDTSTGDSGKPMEKPSDDLSKAIGQLSVTDNETSSAPKNLSDMPIDVAGLIIERSDYKEQLILRKVSKSLRALVDERKPACKSIQVECCMKFIYITLNNHNAVYTDHVEPYHAFYNKHLNMVIRDDFEKAAFDDLTFTLRNPKLQLENFTISDNFSEKKDIDDYYNNIQRVLESLNHQVSIKEIEFRGASPSYLLSILPNLKPGFLEKISLSFQFSGIDQGSRSTGMDQVLRLEQWKQTEELELWGPFDEFPMEYATHFKRFRFNEDYMNVDKFIRIREFLSKSNNFEHCILRSVGFQFEPNLIYQLLGTPVSRNTTEEVFHHSILDSDYYLEFKKATRSLYREIEKKKREDFKQKCRILQLAILENQLNNNLSEVMGQLSVAADNSDETSPSLSDMPIDVVNLITEKLDYKQQLKLRKVSKSLRALVDKLKPACKSIRVNCFEERAYIVMGDTSVIYKSGVDDDDAYFCDDAFIGDVVVGMEEWSSGPFVVIREDFKKAAFDDLACTLKNPKLQLEEFSVHVSYYNEIEKNNNEIRNLLELLDHQLSAKKVDYRVFRPSCLLSILPYLKPGVLEKITLSYDDRGVDWRIDSTGMDQVACLEQWKQAEELELRAPFDKFPMEYATHFKRFKFDESYNMDRNKFIRIKNFLSKLDNFEQCILSCFGSGFRGSISKLFGAPVSRNALEKVFHHPIPDSDYYFEIKLTIFSLKLEITKQKRESKG